MKLSMSLLEKRLSTFHDEAHFKKEARTLKNVRILTDTNQALSPEYVFLGKASDLFPEKDAAGGFVLTDGNSYIHCLDCNYEELLNEVLVIFEFYNQWEQELENMARNHAPMQSMIDTAMKVIDNPCIVTEPDGRLLCAGAIREEYNPTPEVQSILSNKAFPPKHFQREFTDEKGNIVHDIGNYPARYFTENKSSAAVVMHICQNEEPVASLQIFEPEPQKNAFHLHIMEVLSEHLIQAKELSGPLPTIRSNHSILTNLLLGEEVSPEVLEKFAGQLGLNPPWILITLKNLTIQNSAQRNIMIRMLNHSPVPCFAIDFKESVLILSGQNVQEKLLVQLKRELGEANLEIGISMPIQSLQKLPTALRQARFATNYSKGAGVYSCREFAPDYLLENLCNQELVMELLHPAIFLLKNYDEENRTDLLLTLETYLKCDKSQLKTCETLHIHRNTMKYRLESIDRLTGINLSNWREQNYLNLSLQILEYRQESAAEK